MMNTGLVDLCQSEPSCFRNDAPGPDGGEEADEGEGEEGGRDAQHQAKARHHLHCQWKQFNNNIGKFNNNIGNELY